MDNKTIIVRQIITLFCSIIFLLPLAIQAANNLSQKAKNLNAPMLQLNFDYQDQEANFSSPYHSAYSNTNNQLHKSSNEYRTKMGYQLQHVTPEASFNYSPDSYGLGQYYNYQLGVTVPVKDIFSLETRYRWNKFNKANQLEGLDNYQDWSVGVSTTYKGVKLKVDYIDINANDKSQECGKLLSCEGKTIFSIIKQF
jgi:uncharacterized protein (TIGR02001 family)